MKTGYGLLPATLMLLGACTVPVTSADDADPRFIADLPDAVLAAAAPYQDLDAVILRADDGCYWYRHAGPVETTFLPLRTVQGRPICTRAPESA
jgi:hypothetical protein